MSHRLRRNLGIGLALASPWVAAAMLRRSSSPSAARRLTRHEPARHIGVSRRFNHSSALLAASVLADSAVEHYRGSFLNSAMYAPLLAASFSLAAGLHGGTDRNARSHAFRHAIYGVATATGIAGSAFHLYNVTRRPGGWSWNNLFYGAPLGAPAALVLSGALGVVGERLRDQHPREPRLLGMEAGRALGLVVTAGLIGTWGEVALLHFRGSFQHRAMYAPIAVVPVGALLMGRASLGRPRPYRWTRWWLRLVTALGLAGVGFHARGIARSHGGWRNWTQNLLAGPPLPAPPSFTALALAGLAALRLKREDT